MRRTEPDSESTLYETVWQKAELAPRAAAALGGRYLVIGDAQGVGAALAHELQAGGAECELAEGSAALSVEGLRARLSAAKESGKSYRALVSTLACWIRRLCVQDKMWWRRSVPDWARR